MFGLGLLRLVFAQEQDGVHLRLPAVVRRQPAPHVFRGRFDRSLRKVRQGGDYLPEVDLWN